MPDVASTATPDVVTSIVMPEAVKSAMPDAARSTAIPDADTDK